MILGGKKDSFTNVYAKHFPSRDIANFLSSPQIEKGALIDFQNPSKYSIERKSFQLWILTRVVVEKTELRYCKTVTRPVC